MQIPDRSRLTTILLFLTLAATLLGCLSTPTETPTRQSPLSTTAPTSTPDPSTTPHTLFLPEISSDDSPVETPSPPLTPTPSGPKPTPTSTPLPPPVPKPDYGVQLHLFAGGMEETLKWAQGLGVGWVKQQVEWHTIEHGPDTMNWVALDKAVDRADSYGFKILIGTTHAPDWTRPTTLESGPPADYAEFGRFMEQMASRYQGRVDAYELWNEPNLGREWRGDTLDPARFVALVAEGAKGVRAGDLDALVISGAPAVTGINDGETAIDDRVFLRGMYEAGIAQWVDGIGAHPYGYGNPPDASVHDDDHTTSGHNSHPSFFFKDTLEDYRQIMLDYDDDRQIWVTEFGWPSAEGIDGLETKSFPYARKISEEDQANYILRAFRMGEERPWVGPMFLWNLNMAPLWGADSAFSAYSLLRPDGAYRPAYIELRLAEPR